MTFHNWLCWGLTTCQSLWAILCRLPEKGRKEIEPIVEEMKERNREERITRMKVKKQKKQKAHGPWVAHLSDIATADMQMLCNIFPILSSHLGGSVGCAVPLETRRSRVQTPPRSVTFFRGDWSWNIFYGHSLPSADSRRAVVSFWRKNVHNTG